MSTEIEILDEVIAAALGLPATATESEILAAAKSMKEKADRLGGVERAKLAQELAKSEQDKATLTTERDAALKRAKDVDVTLADLQLAVFVGVKITATEKAGLLELAAESRDMFNKTLAGIRARPNMPPPRARATGETLNEHLKAEVERGH